MLLDNESQARASFLLLDKDCSCMSLYCVSTPPLPFLCTFSTQARLYCLHLLRLRGRPSRFVFPCPSYHSLVEPSRPFWFYRLLYEPLTIAKVMMSSLLTCMSVFLPLLHVTGSNKSNRHTQKEVEASLNRFDQSGATGQQGSSSSSRSNGSNTIPSQLLSQASLRSPPRLIFFLLPCE